jgi:hypothetical protein
MLDPGMVFQRKAPEHSYNSITLLQEELCEIRPILTGDTRDECCLQLR